MRTLLGLVVLFGAFFVSGCGGTAPGGVPIGGAAYPPDSEGPGSFTNDGTSQPKLSALP